MKYVLLTWVFVVLLTYFGISRLPDPEPPILPIGPPLPPYVILHYTQVDDLAVELAYYRASGYVVATSSGGIGGPLIVLSLESSCR